MKASQWLLPALGVGAALLLTRKKGEAASAAPTEPPAPGEVITPPEIPSGLLPPAEPPSWSAAGLAAGEHRGTINLVNLPDPKIVAMKANDTVILRLPPMDRDGYVRVDFIGLAPDGVETPMVDIIIDRAWTMPGLRRFSAQDPVGWDTALYNVGGQSQRKLIRGPIGRNDGLPGDLYVETKSSWGPGDWAQIRLYPGVVTA